MITENLLTLKIHKLTKEQYNRELSAGRIDENALYLTPDEGSIDLSDYATKEYVDDQIAQIDIPEGGAEQVQSDWNETDESSPAYIKNKPIISNNGSISVQSNWDQEDETQLDYIKNKPFYEYIDFKNILSKTVYSDFQLNSDFGLYFYEEEVNFSFVPNETYKIIWDDVEYECVAMDVSSMLPGAIAVGNGAVAGFPGNNEPFILMTNNGYLVIAPLTDTNAHSVAIDKKELITKQIDSKYIPIPFFGNTKSMLFNHTFTLEELDDGAFVVEDSLTPDLINGKVYSVSVNSKAYSCVCTLVSDAGISLPILAPEDFSFVLIRDFQGALAGIPAWNFVPTTETIEESYEIIIEQPTIKYLDNKYLDFINVFEPFLDGQIPFLLENENSENPEESLFIYVCQDLNTYTSLNQLEINEKYRITYEGNDYISTAIDASDMAPSTIPTVTKAYYIGNPSYFITDMANTGEPFLIVFLSGYDESNNMIGQCAIMIHHTPEIETINVDFSIQSVKSGSFIKPEAIPEEAFSDWDEMDNTKPSFIKNRPFGLVLGDKIFNEEITLTQNVEGDTIFQATKLQIPLVEGQTYQVKFAGETFYCVCQSAMDAWGEEDDDALTLGNGYILYKTLPDTGENFLIGVGTGGGYLCIATFGGTYKLEITSCETKKIDPKFLPSSTSGLPEVTNADNGKILRVVDGLWTAVALPSAEEASF